MNKQETAIVVLLVFVLVGWFVFNSPSARMAPAPETRPGETAAEGPVTNGAAPAVVEAAAPEEPPREPIVAAPAAAPEPGERPPLEPEQVVQLTNAFARVSVSSWGGGIVRVEYNEFRQDIDPDSGPLALGFRDRPALSLARLSGLTTNAAFTLEPSGDGRAVTVSRETANGLRFVRRLSLADKYQLKIEDVLTNTGDQTVPLPRHAMRLGLMSPFVTKASTRGMTYLGIDTLPETAEEGITHWNKSRFLRSSQLERFFKNEGGADADTVDDQSIGRSVAWVGVKNKFFVQLLTPLAEGGAVDCEIYARRDPGDKKGRRIDRVGAALVFAERTLGPGEAREQAFNYYVGPKKYALLKELGRHQDKVMEFGRWFGRLCGPLLWILNAIYGVIPNYGVAIILLTVLVRLVFWPVMHKSTASMKRMQDIQPLVAELRKKHEGNPQKIQRETMALYKEHKVNPMASCLPMLIQIPVFIALFTVLRSAVELRFAEFLWVRDLSEPEAIPLGTLLFMKGPFTGIMAFSVNFLPLYMTVTMALQQRLTPSAADPQQKSMMMIMPIVLLVMFYNMAAALVLYWSTSQSLAIVQMFLQQRRSKRRAADAAATTPTAAR